MKYSDLNATAMVAEVHRIRRHIALFKEVHSEESICKWTALDLLCWIINWKLQESLVNIVVALRFF